MLNVAQRSAFRFCFPTTDLPALRGPDEMECLVLPEHTTSRSGLIFDRHVHPVDNVVWGPTSEPFSGYLKGV